MYNSSKNTQCVLAKSSKNGQIVSNGQKQQKIEPPQDKMSQFNEKQSESLHSKYADATNWADILHSFQIHI